METRKDVMKTPVFWEFSELQVSPPLDPTPPWGGGRKEGGFDHQNKKTEILKTWKQVLETPKIHTI